MALSGNYNVELSELGT